MFGKSAEDRGRMETRGGKASVLSSDLELHGKVSSTGAIEINGRVDGEVDGASVVLGSEGEILGRLRAESADVMGRIEGEVSADSLTLRSSSKAQIIVTSKILVIESGATVEGQFNKPAPAKPAPVQETAPVVAPEVQPENGGIE